MFGADAYLAKKHEARDSGVVMDWKEDAADWLKSQGVSTVLLIFIVCIISYAALIFLPKLADAQTEKFTGALEKITASHDRDRDLFEKVIFRELEKVKQ